MRHVACWIDWLAINLNRVAITVAEIALFILMLTTVYAVVARYVFRSPSVYAMEVSIYILLLLAWCSVGWVHHENRHVSMEALNVKLTGRWKRATEIISQGSILIFCAVLVWAGSNIVITAIERNYRSSSLLKFPLWVAYVLIPVGGLLLGLVALRRLRNPDPMSAENSLKEE